MNTSEDKVSFIPLGGVGDVTKNMYLYEFADQILIVDCGLGFADETMVGIDLLLPDIAYLLEQKANKKIVGLVLTHGHEDHIGGLPFILPQLNKLFSFPVFGTPLTAALANEKLKELSLPPSVQAVPFGEQELSLGSFTVSFIRVTHSVPDSANLFIKTPVGNFYHGSDFKFDLTPVDGKKTEFTKIAKVGAEGIRCLMSDCLGSEREGYTPSEEALSEGFEKELERCKGKFIVTTYSSNISRLNQAISAGKKFGRKVCFVGRSLVKAKEVAQKLGYLQLSKDMEIPIENLKDHEDKRILLLVAGSQGQENSAMVRIANDEHKEIKIGRDDVVVFSADPIPGNETSVNSLIDTISKKGAKVLYSDISDKFHVSGHGSSLDLLFMMSLLKPQKLLPISGTFRHMVAYRLLAEKLGYSENDVFLLEDGQEVVFTKNQSHLGKKIKVSNVYVDEISKEEIEHFVLRDRKRLSEGGVVVIMVEIDSATSQIVGKPNVITRGITFVEGKRLESELMQEYKKGLKGKGKVINWIHIRNLIGEISERYIFKKFRRRPLVLPVVVEV